MTTMNLYTCETCKKKVDYMGCQDCDRTCIHCGFDAIRRLKTSSTNAYRILGAVKKTHNEVEE